MFIAGNGFDMAHGIPTSYHHFRSFVIDLYPEALNLRDEIVYLDDFENINPREFAAEILLHTMDNATGEYWCNFEEALASIDFNRKLPEANHKKNETIEEDHKLMKHYLLYLDMLTSVFINCTKIWQDFFRLWMKAIQTQIEERAFTEKDTLKILFSQPDMQFLTFNYTKTLQILYGIKRVIHVHNRVGQTLVFGHGRENIMYNQFNHNFSTGTNIGSSFLNDMVTSFKKDTDSPLRKYSDFFKKLDDNVNNIYSYGFSYSKVDRAYIKKIISQIAPNAVWHFTQFEAQNSEELRIKKIKLRRYGFKGAFGIF